MVSLEMQRFKEHKKHLFEDIDTDALALSPLDLKHEWETKWESIKKRFSHAPLITVLATSVLIVPLVLVHVLSGVITLLIGLFLNPPIVRRLMPIVYKDMVDLIPE